MSSKTYFWVDENGKRQLVTNNSPTLLRFWSKVNKNTPIHPTLNTNCWIWTGNKIHRYGTMFIDKKRWQAHRYSWSLHFGEIPDGLLVCHKCDNPPCVNPDHLFLGTDLDNAVDRESKDRGNIGKRNGQVKLTIEQVVEIKRRFICRCTTNGYTALAREFGVSPQNVCDIVKGRTWNRCLELFVEDK